MITITINYKTYLTFDENGQEQMERTRTISTGVS